MSFHALHSLGDMPGRLRILSLPPADTAPAEIAELTGRYNDAAAELTAARVRRRELSGAQPERHADIEDGNAIADGRKAVFRERLNTERRDAGLAVLGLERRLDRVLRDLIAAHADHGDEWTGTVAGRAADSETRCAEALATLQRESEELIRLRRLSDWIASFPHRAVWTGTLQPIPDEALTPISSLSAFLRGERPTVAVMSHPDQMPTGDAA